MWKRMRLVYKADQGTGDEQTVDARGGGDRRGTRRGWVRGLSKQGLHNKQEECASLDDTG